MNTTHTPHTPLEWRAFNDRYIIAPATDSEAGKVIATFSNPKDLQAAVACVNAAPDLLAALQGCIKVMQCADELSSDARFWIEEATATINKAKGITA